MAKAYNNLDKYTGSYAYYKKLTDWSEDDPRMIYLRAREAGHTQRVYYANSFQSSQMPLAITGGRMFKPDAAMPDADSWAYNRTSQDLSTSIETPEYIIESLLREEIYVERDILITAVTTSGSFKLIQCNDLKSEVDDYYNGAYILNHKTTIEFGIKVLDYVASTKTLYIDSSYGEPSGYISLSNINPNINTASFDLSGNSVTGLRKDWKMSNSILSVTSSDNIFSSICNEAFIWLCKDESGYRIITDDPSNIAGTFQYHIAKKGIIDMQISYTPASEICTDFKLHYYYSYGRASYLKELSVNPKSASVASLNDYITVCADAEQNYRVSKKWEYSADWIRDDATALAYLIKIINQHTRQLLIASFKGDLQNHLKYVIGDKVLIYMPSVLPDTINYSKVFMIFSKKININSSTVEFGLIEMAEQPENINITTEVPEDLTTEDEDLFFIE